MAAGQPLGGHQGVDPSRADLVGPRHHGDGARDRTLAAQARQVLEVAHVCAPDLTHEVDHDVDGRRHRLRCQELVRPARRDARQGVEAGRVDQRVRAQRRRRPPDVDMVDLVGGRTAQVDLEAGPAGHRWALPRASRPGMDGDARRLAVAVPGDRLRALGRVRRGDACAHERVEQRRLARLDEPREADGQRSLEALEQLAQLRPRPPRRPRTPRPPPAAAWRARRADGRSGPSSSRASACRRRRPPAGTAPSLAGHAGTASSAGSRVPLRVGAEAFEVGDALTQLVQRPGALVRSGPGRLAGGADRLVQRAHELVGPGGEVVAQHALQPPEPVLRVLADLEGDLVEVPLDGDLGLGLTSTHAVRLVLAVGATAQDDADAHRDGVDERHAERDRGDHAEHQHATVGAAQRDDDLLGPRHPLHLDALEPRDELQRLAVVALDELGQGEVVRVELGRRPARRATEPARAPTRSSRRPWPGPAGRATRRTRPTRAPGRTRRPPPRPRGRCGAAGRAGRTRCRPSGPSRRPGAPAASARCVAAGHPRSACRSAGRR